jgi:hypothetical protein
MSTPQKAEIINVDTNTSVAKCLFNPREYSFSKSNSWEKQKNAGGNVPQVTFAGGEPATLQVELLFDTYLEGGERAQDVRKKYTEKIWELMKVNPSLAQKKPKKARPPFVKFHWGDAWSFVGVITSIQEKFTLFTSNGTPARATLNITLQQLRDEGTLPPQNPTSRHLRQPGVDGGRRQSVLDRRERVRRCDPWRRIAEANHLQNVRELRPGTVLVIRCLSEEFTARFQVQVEGLDETTAQSLPRTSWTSRWRAACICRTSPPSGCTIPGCAGWTTSGWTREGTKLSARPADGENSRCSKADRRAQSPISAPPPTGW